MITLDGVMQAPGAPGEDPSGEFNYGGWIAPFDDEVSGKLMQRLMKPTDILIGRKTFDIWADYWPQHADGWPGINEVTKYVMSTTLKNSDPKVSAWKNTMVLGDLAAIIELKSKGPGPHGSDIQVWGSSELIQLLLLNDLVDELWLMIHPITLGKGKKLFTSGPIPAAFTLIESIVTTQGVIMGHYKRAGDVKTGTVGG